MRTIVMLLCALVSAATLITAEETVEVFGHEWTVLSASDWKVDNAANARVLQLLTAKGPVPGQPRRPQQFAVAKTPEFGKVTVDAEVMPRKRSLIIVYNYRDPAHFNYAHLSTDTGTKQPVHNGVFHVFGGERVRISPLEGPAAFAEINRWYRVHLVQDGETGSVQVEVDGKPMPAIHAVDLSLSSGKVGLGSFDEIGDFKNVRISGTPARGATTN